MTGTGAESGDVTPDPSSTPPSTPNPAPPAWAPPAPVPQTGYPAPGYPPPGYPVPPPGYGPLPPGAPGGPPSRRRSAIFTVAAVLVMGLIYGACFAGSQYVNRTMSEKIESIAGETAAPGFPYTEDDPAPTASQDPAVDEGPQASQYPADSVYDLNRVCQEDVYYAELPKRTGKAPHPVRLFYDAGDDLWVPDGGFWYDEGISDANERVWGSDDVAEVQMIGCLERVSTGTKIRNCEYDDPEPETVQLYRAGWRLRVIEAATGKVLLTKSLKGDEQTCPYVVSVGEDKKIYASVSDRAKLSALRPLVKK
ncbi:hypothetical protein [Actinoplanes sp. NPDC051851]|uniref:hypothetical protein n=1 Tax=Actinoplanes sp. NPDC051851 TaxID=3154753 RepID=UPI0034377164